MKCPSCGAENNDGSKFCHSCGASMVVAPVALAPDQGVAAPQPATAAPQPAATGVVYATFWQRFVASLIDGIILMILSSIVGFIFGLILTSVDGAEVGSSLSGLLGTVIGAIYYIMQESSPKQATFGKHAMGLKVTDMEGNRVTAGKATSRYFAHIVSGLTLGIGYLTVAFTPKKQGIHDMIAGTLVVVKK